MRCQKCSKTIHKNQKVCPWCGTSQKAEQEPKQVRLSAKGTKKKLTEKQKKWIIGSSVTAGAVVLALVITVVSVVFSMLGQVNRTSELSNIDANPNLPPAQDVQNIALFGLDTRSNDEAGRSDAIIILSVDRIHGKIKMTSIARDSLVAIEGHGQSKITHAFMWGRANLAVKTLNRNFGMNITDYVYINFYEFAEIIDYIGGVAIDVDSAEAGVMNKTYGPELQGLGFSYENVSAGYQMLTGAQALAYSRNRYTGSDIDRGNRQKEVLEAMFTQVKDLPVTKYPSVISQILSICHTNLTNGEMLSIATWAATSSPSFEQFTIPSPECKAQGGNWGDGHGWVWRFDMALATDILHNFIYEESTEANGTTAPPKSTTRRTPAPLVKTTQTQAPQTTTTSATVAAPTTTTTVFVTTATTTTTTTTTTVTTEASTSTSAVTDTTVTDATSSDTAATETTTAPATQESTADATDSTTSVTQTMSTDAMSATDINSAA